MTSVDTMSSESLRNAMVDKLAADHAAKGLVLRPEVKATMRTVPRELFTPGLPLEEAYDANAAVLKKMRGEEAISSVSAPYLIAEMIGQAAAVIAVHPPGERPAARTGHRIRPGPRGDPHHRPLIDDPIDEHHSELRKNDLQELGVTQHPQYPHGNCLSPHRNLGRAVRLTNPRATDAALGAERIAPSHAIFAAQPPDGGRRTCSWRGE